MWLNACGKLPSWCPATSGRAGYVAGLYAKDNDIDTISSVGGQKIPPVDHYIAGYRAGAEAANEGIKVLNGYSQDFVDQGKCKELALSQIERGSKVVFQVAGQCGLGALDAAKQRFVALFAHEVELFPDFQRGILEHRVFVRRDLLVHDFLHASERAGAYKLC